MSTRHDAPPDGVPEDPGNSVDGKARPKHKNSAREELINRILSYILFVIATVNEYLTDVIPGQGRRLMAAKVLETDASGAKPGDDDAGAKSKDDEDEHSAETTVGPVQTAKDVEVDNDSAVDIPNEDFEFDGVDAPRDATFDEHAGVDGSDVVVSEGHEMNGTVVSEQMNDTVAFPDHAEAFEEPTAATETHEPAIPAQQGESKVVETVEEDTAAAGTHEAATLAEEVENKYHVEAIEEETAAPGTNDTDIREAVTLAEQVEIHDTVALLEDHIEAVEELTATETHKPAGPAQEGENKEVETVEEETVAPGTDDTDIHEAVTLAAEEVEINDTVALPEDHIEAVEGLTAAPETNDADSHDAVVLEVQDVEINDHAIALPENSIEAIEDTVAPETEDVDTHGVVSLEVDEIETKDNASALPEDHADAVEETVAPETENVEIHDEAVALENDDSVTLEAKDVQIHDEAVALSEDHVDSVQETVAPETDDAVTLEAIQETAAPETVENNDEMTGTKASELTDVDFDTKLSSHLASLVLSPFFADNDYVEQVVEKARKLKAASSLQTDDLFDLATLALYQPVAYCDDSTSMWDGSRIQDQIQLVTHMSSISTRLAPQGYGSSLQFLNHTRELDSDLPAAEVARIISDVRPNGSTKLGTSLKSKVLDPMVYDVLNKPNGKLSRPVLISCLIDGPPTGEARDTLQRTISDCMDFLEQKGYKHTAVLYQIGQIGNDEDAAVFLLELCGDAKLKEVLHCSTERLDEAYKLHESEEELERWLAKVLLRPTRQE